MFPSDVVKAIHEVMNFKLFEINQTAITLSSLIIFTFVFAAFALVSRIVRRLLRAQIFSRLSIDEGTQYTLSRITHYIVMVIGAAAAAGRKAAQQEGLVSIRSTTDLDFDIFPDLMPIGSLSDLLGKAAKLRTRRSNHVAAPR